MGKQLRNLWKSWNYYFFAPDELQSCFPQIRSHNVNVLKITSLLALILIIGFIFFPIFLDKNLQEFFVFIIVAAIQTGIFFYARHQAKKPSTVLGNIFAIYCILFFSLLFFGIYITIISSYTIPAVNFYIFLVFSQILFIPALRIIKFLEN